tara:strand:- start:378 stop:518 length:141 start_codon:yes stop_codon:yes gene_type:complete
MNWDEENKQLLTIPKQKLQRSLLIFGACAIATGIAVGNYLTSGSCM